MSFSIPSPRVRRGGSDRAAQKLRLVGFVGKSERKKYGFGAKAQRWALREFGRKSAFLQKGERMR